MFTPTLFRTIANYLMWQISNKSVPYLNEVARNLYFKYYSVIYVNSERNPRWKECIHFVSNRYLTRNLLLTILTWNFLVISLGNAVGAMYVREYFDETVRQSVKEMLKDIQRVFTEILDELD